MEKSDIQLWYESLPKVELHLHLEGAIPIEALWKLLQKYKVLEVPTIEDLREQFTYKDFSHFIELWIWKNGFLREYEDFSFIAEAVARNLVKQNIKYAEVFFSPTDFSRNNLTVQKIATAVAKGIRNVPEVEIVLIADLVRDTDPKQAEITLDKINEVRSVGIIGIGLGGPEHDFPPKPFVNVYKKARQLGFRTTAHAGEALGPESIWDAINELQVERIGHGTSAREDQKLLTYLAETQLPVEMCPYSNICTGVVSSIEKHPIRQFFDKGILVTINTDDPMMFNNSLAKEYSLLQTHHNFTPLEIQQLILNGITASWLSQERKNKMKKEFQENPAWNAV